MIDPEDLKRSLDKAKLQLMSIKKSIFTSTVLFSLKFSWDESIPTANTDGIHLNINPNFWLGLSAPERVFLLAHETWHICFEHITRYGELNQKEEDKDFKVFNEACDYVINNMLNKRGYSVPKGALCDPRYDGKIEEAIYYELLADKQKQDPNFQPDFTPAPEGKDSQSQEEREKIKQQLDEILVKAHIANEMEAGNDSHDDNLPECVKDRIYKLTNPKVPWRDTLRQYCFDKQKVDSSFARPNRRYLQQGLILPSPYGDAMGKMTIAVDVSGSIDEDDFNAFMSEATAIKDIMNPSEVEFIQWHHGISDITTVDMFESLEDKVSFGETGGTDVHPLLDHCTKNPPQIMVIFTDGYFHPYQRFDDINFPIIWTIYDNDSFTSEKGQVVHFDPKMETN